MKKVNKDTKEETIVDYTVDHATSATAPIRRWKASRLCSLR